MIKKDTTEKNHGVDLKREKLEQSEKDWIYGAILAKGIADDVAGVITALNAWPRPRNGIYERTLGKINHCVISWIKRLAQYYPKGEVQNLGAEKMDCVVRGFNNELEKILNYLVAKKIFPDSTIYWLRVNKFFDADGKIVLSNRIPAKMSGTTIYGNSLKSVAEWIREHGIYPRALLPEDKPMSWNDYYDRSRITKDMLDIGEASKDVIQINYAKVYKRKFAKFFGNFFWKIFDNYIDVVDGDFVKELAQDYIFLGYGYRLIIHSHPKEEIITQEITDAQVREAYMKRPDLQKEFPAWNKFYSVTKPKYTIYDWARKHGINDNPEIFDKPKHTTYIYTDFIKWIRGLFNNKK